jgi:hypothetical protein
MARLCVGLEGAGYDAQLITSQAGRTLNDLPAWLLAQQQR